MKTPFTVTLSMLAGAALGAAAVQGLHAQAKPPVYYVSEIDVRDVDAWQKDYAPKAQAVIKAAGGRVLAAGQKVTGIEGAPPKPRVAIIQWESAEQVQAWVNSAARKELMPPARQAWNSPRLYCRGPAAIVRLRRNSEVAPFGGLGGHSFGQDYSTRNPHPACARNHPSSGRTS